MRENIEIDDNEDNKSEHNCKCGNKEVKKGSCKGGCSCHSNTIEKASQELINLIKIDDINL